VTKVTRAQGKEIVTIEGLSQNNDHPVQQAWQEITKNGEFPQIPQIPLIL